MNFAAPLFGSNFVGLNHGHLDNGRPGAGGDFAGKKADGTVDGAIGSLLMGPAAWAGAKLLNYGKGLASKGWNAAKEKVGWGKAAANAADDLPEGKVNPVSKSGQTPATHAPDPHAPKPGSVAKVGTEVADDAAKAAAKGATVVAKGGTEIATVAKAGMAAKVGGGALKVIGKALPGIGAAAAGAAAYDRLQKGDKVGAAIEVGLGAVSFVPVVGTAASLVGQAGFALSDYLVGREEAKSAALRSETDQFLAQQRQSMIDRGFDPDKFKAEREGRRLAAAEQSKLTTADVEAQKQHSLAAMKTQMAVTMAGNPAAPRVEGFTSASTKATPATPAKEAAPVVSLPSQESFAQYNTPEMAPSRQHSLAGI